MTTQLINGDCLEKMKDIPDGSVDLVVTSPPYDNLRTYNGNNALWGEHVWKVVIQDLFRVVKQGGVIVWVVGDKVINKEESGTSFKQALWAKDCGFNLHDTMIYKKTSSSLPDKKRYSNVFEYMFIFSKGVPNSVNFIVDKVNHQAGSTNPTKKRNADGKMIRTDKKYTIPPYGKRINIWEYEVGYMKGTKDRIAFQHPATFPEKLAHDHIISWSNEGDTVLDPFMGSGTTGKMAKQLGRSFIGIEMDSTYFEIAKKRIEDTPKEQNPPLTNLNNND